MRVKSNAFVNQAILAADQNPSILYKEEDCQAFVENTVKRAGGTIPDYRGSNDMFRNACSSIQPLKDAKKERFLVPGAVLFIHAMDGKEPSRYKPDGLGNAWHVGIYCAGKYEVVHSSASRGAVVPSTLKNGWTHVGWLKAVDYGSTTKEDPMNNLSTLSLGSRGDNVRHLQERLIRLDYDVGIKTGADGIFGKATQHAIQQFQKDHALPVTGAWGAVDESTLAARFVQTPFEDQPTPLPDRIRAIADELLLIADQIIF